MSYRSGGLKAKAEWVVLHTNGAYIQLIYSTTMVHSELIVQTAVGRQNRARSPFGVVGAEKGDERRNIVNFANTGSCWGRVDKWLHVLEELLVALKPLV